MIQTANLWVKGGRGARPHCNAEELSQNRRSGSVLTLPKSGRLPGRMGMRSSSEGKRARCEGESDSQDAHVTEVVMVNRLMVNLRCLEPITTYAD
jgi:hypothetical protein